MHIIMGIGQSEGSEGEIFCYVLLSYDPGDHPPIEHWRNKKNKIELLFAPSS
jgi:hypothetical protein